jgi:hypothetical protein
MISRFWYPCMSVKMMGRLLLFSEAPCVMCSVGQANGSQSVQMVVVTHSNLRSL